MFKMVKDLSSEGYSVWVLIALSVVSIISFTMPLVQSMISVFNSSVRVLVSALFIGASAFFLVLLMRGLFFKDWSVTGKSTIVSIILFVGLLLGGIYAPSMVNFSIVNP